MSAYWYRNISELYGFINRGDIIEIDFNGRPHFVLFIGDSSFIRVRLADGVCPIGERGWVQGVKETVSLDEVAQNYPCRINNLLEESQGMTPRKIEDCIARASSGIQNRLGCCNVRYNLTGKNSKHYCLQWKYMDPSEEKNWEDYVGKGTCIMTIGGIVAVALVVIKQFIK